MKRFQATRIVILLIVIFALGIVTGRLSAPTAPTVLTTSSGKQVTAPGVFSRLAHELKLDKAQESQVAAILDEAAEKMTATAVGSPERLTVFRSYVGKVRAVLNSEQQVRFDQMVRETEQRQRQENRRSKSGDLRK